MKVREARPGELVAVRSIFDAAMLQVPDLDRSEVLVAAEEGRVLGALAVAPTAGGGAAGGGGPDAGDRTGEIRAVAVRPRRRGQNIGAGLVEAAAERYAVLVAEFGPGAGPFYDALGFDVRSLDDGRLRGTR